MQSKSIKVNLFKAPSHANMLFFFFYNCFIQYLSHYPTDETKRGEGEAV